MAKISDVDIPSLLFTEVAAPATPAATKARLYLDTADGILKWKDDAGVVREIGTALTNPMTTAGDIIKGGTAGVAERLGVGSAGQVLTVVSGAPAWAAAPGAGGYDEGSSFPGSPSTNDKFYRPDRNLLYFYDGTRWLTTSEYLIPFHARVLNGFAASGVVAHAAGMNPTDMYLVRFDASLFVSGTNNGSNNWTVALDRVATGADNATGQASFNTSADAGSTWLWKTASMGTVLTGSTNAGFRINLTRNGSPGSLFAGFSLVVRLVG